MIWALFKCRVADGSQGEFQTALATSTDGIHFTKYGLVLGRSITPEGGWNNYDGGGTFSESTVYYEAGTFYLFYYGKAGSLCQIGLATSKDGYHFTLYNKNPVLTDMPVAQPGFFAKFGTGAETYWLYYMYWPSGDGSAYTNLAFSPGINLGE
jgi:hypothetical protein